MSMSNTPIIPSHPLSPKAATYAMPVHNKPRNQAARLQSHHRTGSGGSSKVGLNNLALTQKDGPQSKQQNLKRSGHSATDLHQGRFASQYPRAAHLTSNSRVQSKDQISAAQRHAPSLKGKPQQQQRPNFSIARSDETTDSDDEWVSSESGATTPQTNVAGANRDKDEGGHGTITPLGRQRTEDELPENMINGGNNFYGNTDRAINGADDVTTPRAEVELDLTRAESGRPDVTPVAAATASTSRQAEMKPPVVRVQAQSTPATPVPTLPTPPAVEQPTKKAPLIRQAYSEAPSPTQPRQKSTAKRMTVMRNVSTQGELKRDMPPHPLIRGQSYHGAGLRPARLAPLTVNAEAAQAQLTGSPPTPSRSGSPSYFTSSFKDSPSETSTENQDRLPSRKGSISSLHSIATLPAPASARFGGGRGKQDRTRTLSTISTSSSSAALTALSALPLQSRPSSPPSVVRFPPADGRRDPYEGFHHLLPPQCLETHMTGVAKYNPLYDSYERVMRAKHGR